MKIQSTIVFQKNWEAIHEPCPKHCNGADGCEWCQGSNRKYKYIINEGSSRSSKTYSLIDVCDLYLRNHKGKRLIIWGDSKEEVVKAILREIKKRHVMTDRYNVGYNHRRTDNDFEYNNGSTQMFMGADNPDIVMKLTQDFAWFNEPYNISRESFDQIDQRTSDFILLDWNPKQAHWIDDLKKSRRAIVIKSTFKDNPFCPPEQRAKILSYQPISRCEAVESGKLDEKEAIKYDLANNPDELSPVLLKELSRCIRNEETNSADEFNWQVYGLGEKGEKPDRIYHWKKCTKQQFDAIDAKTYYGIDWGKVDPWAISAVKYYDGQLFVHELNYKSENELMKELTISQHKEIRQTNEGLVVWRMRQLGIPKNAILVCDNNRPDKIKALRKAGWEYAVATTKGKGSIKDGISVLDDLDVYYTEESKNIEYEQENYQWKTDRYGVRLEDPEDKDNHTLDGIRYVSMWLRSEGIIRVV